jgi:hypothetical protein
MKPPRLNGSLPLPTQSIASAHSFRAYRVPREATNPTSLFIDAFLPRREPTAAVPFRSCPMIVRPRDGDKAIFVVSR